MIFFCDTLFLTANSEKYVLEIQERKEGLSVKLNSVTNLILFGFCIDYSLFSRSNSICSLKNKMDI